MAWFISQSAVALALAFGLGLLLGRLAWSSTTVTTTREELLGTLAGEHRAELAARDRELERTRADLAARTRELEDTAGDGGSAGGAGNGVPDGASGDGSGDGVSVADRIPAQGGRAAAGPEAEAAPAAVAVVEEGDALERIEGIGPKIANALRASGVRTFSALAAAEDDDLRAALEAAGLRFSPSLGTWRRQARLLAEGDEPGFDELRTQLSGGRG